MKFLVLGSVLIIIGCRLCRCNDTEEDEYPRVETLLGTIEGTYKISNEGKKYESFMGIPYAVPITEEQRFQNAKPVEPWTGVLSAKAFGPWCIQIGVLSLISTDPEVHGAEDCLYLNVYTPSRTKSGNGTKESTDLLPVIFYIHGGGYQFGSGAEFGPDYLLDEEVILVTSNYRLGPLGFLSTEDSVIPGNLGLKDQVLAMRWVKDNILYFGGDPESITLIGQSAGGVSVHLHYLSKLSKGLFNRGMSLSGNALDCWPKSDGNLEKTKKVSAIVGCPSSDVQEMVDCLKTRSAENITLASVHFAEWINAPISPFGAVVEAEETNSSFISREPIDLIISGEVHDLPWITSTVSVEGLAPGALFVANDELIEELNDNWDEILPYLLDFNYTIPTSDQKNVSQLIREHYVGSNPINNSNIYEIIRIVGDRLFYSQTERATRLQATVMKSPVRSFFFSYRGEHSASEIFTNTTMNFGVMHLDDLPYTLNIYFNSTTTEQDHKMQKLMTNLWVSFATCGVPNVGVEWPEFDPSLDLYEYLEIAGPDEICINSTSNFGDKNFWQSIPFRENIITLNNETKVAKN